jgi:UDP-N-acetylmuramate dehydrogenase
MKIKHNVSLQPYNSFGIDVIAQEMATFNSIIELSTLLDYCQQNSLPFLILGGGSNILFTKNYKGIVLQNKMLGIELVDESSDFYFVKAAAGENWHQFVLHCICNNYSGVENLSLIPGCVGAAPIQNIGAYGVEVKDIIYEVAAFDVETKKVVIFSNAQCNFGYRDSVFKNIAKDKFVIVSVTFKLLKQPNFNINYGAIEQELLAMGNSPISIKKISDAVIAIRTSKLPNPAIIGNAGSFFKNPVINEAQYVLLKNSFHSIAAYPSKNNTFKIAAGWLIEQCGFKGFRNGDAGCHQNQALVLVNYGNATGSQIYDISSQIKQSVLQKFNIELEREVNIL